MSLEFTRACLESLEKLKDKKYKPYIIAMILT
jgi:hypothetical protein